MLDGEGKIVNKAQDDAVNAESSELLDGDFGHDQDTMQYMPVGRNSLLLWVLIQSISEMVKRDRKQVVYAYPAPEPAPKAPARRKKAGRKVNAKGRAAKRIKLSHFEDAHLQKRGVLPSLVDSPRSSVSQQSQESSDDSDAECTSEGQLFCLCRRPDDHSVMVGCDGPCQDWFHMKCVGMLPSQVKLVYKWYCM